MEAARSYDRYDGRPCATKNSLLLLSRMSRYVHSSLSTAASASEMTYTEESSSTSGFSRRVSERMKSMNFSPW